MKKSLLFFKKRINKNVSIRVQGLKSEMSGYYHPWIEFNHFKKNPVKISKTLKKIKPPKKSFILKYIANPNSVRLRKTTFTPYKSEWYSIIDNRTTPYIVYINEKRNSVYIYRIPKNSYVMNKDWSINANDNLCYFTDLVAKYKNLKDIMIGVDYNEKKHGNSILLRLNSKKYLYIGDCIYSFTSDETITNYYSNMGNNEVPYPVGVSKSYIYFMLDKVFVDKEEFDNNDLNDPMAVSDIYGEFYKISDKTRHTRFRKYRLVKKRLI